MRVKSILMFLLILAISIAVVSPTLSMGVAPARRSIARASGLELQGMIIDLGIPVKLADINGDGTVESLKHAATGEIVYTFSSPIPAPKGGDVIRLEGNITLSGGSFPVRPGTLLLVD